MNGQNTPTFAELVKMLDPVMANPPEIYEWNGKWCVNLSFDDIEFDTFELAEEYVKSYNAFIDDKDNWHQTEH